MNAAMKLLVPPKVGESLSCRVTGGFERGTELARTRKRWSICLSPLGLVKGHALARLRENLENEEQSRQTQTVASSGEVKYTGSSVMRYVPPHGVTHDR